MWVIKNFPPQIAKMAQLGLARICVPSNWAKIVKALSTIIPLWCCTKCPLIKAVLREKSMVVLKCSGRRWPYINIQDEQYRAIQLILKGKIHLYFCILCTIVQYLDFSSWIWIFGFWFQNFDVQPSASSCLSAILACLVTYGGLCRPSQRWHHLA